MKGTRRFALRSLDRLLSAAWNPQLGLKHVVAYSGQQTSAKSEAAKNVQQCDAGIPGLLDDYAFTVLACLDAFESTADTTYFDFAREIAGRMIERFYDREGGGFFDMPPDSAARIGVLAARRKPFQDSPTPAGNSATVIGLLRLYTYTDDANYRELAQKTLDVLAGTAAQFGIFAATYGIAAVMISRPHTQIVVVGSDAAATELCRTALLPFALNKSVLRLADNEATPQYLPPALRETVPQIPAVQQGRTVAILCTDSTCQPPVEDTQSLTRLVREAISGRASPSASAAD